MPSPRSLAVLAGLLCSAALAEESKWETVATGTITVKSRARAGSAMKDIWAEGEIDAPLAEVQGTLVDPENFPKFMPYVKESRTIGKPEADGSVFVYTKLDFPVVASRDYIVKVTVEEGVKPDGTGAFRQRWVAVPDKTPERKGVVRLKLNEGTWHITPRGESKCYAIYKFTTDPGGWIPNFAIDMGNKTGVTDTFKAVEKEAKRRVEAKKSTASKP
jgi:hypothetical protein